MSRSGTVLFHIRRCHVCGGVTEHSDQVECCSSCGKTIVPFFYFDDKAVSPLWDCKERPAEVAGRIRPLVGLSAVWAHQGKS